MSISVAMQPYAPSFSDTSLRFAAQLMLEVPDKEPSVELAAALVCQAQLQGHICVDLSDANRFMLPAKGNESPASLPELAQWKSTLKGCPLVADGVPTAPLVLEGDRLYLGRYFFYEKYIAERLGALAESSVQEPMITAHVADEVDWQKVAVAVALKRRLTIISGGPGTGKTTTLVKILEALTAAEPKVKILLAAPTGKAAGRMQEALQSAIATSSSQLHDHMPAAAVTLHRLLGVKHGSVYFRQNHNAPLNADVVVIDEASMVDMAMMAKLLDALKPETRLILLGDRDQLASVEAGSVLGDICSLQGREVAYSETQAQWLADCGMRVASDPKANQIADSIVVLQKSYRFDDSSGIGCLARAINQGDFSGVKTVLEGEQFSEVRWQSSVAVAEYLTAPMVAHWREVMASEAVEDALQAMSRYRVLLAVREGPYGVAEVNRLAVQLLRKANVLTKPVDTDFYAGQPIMVLKNDPVTGLSNGDVGLIWPDESDELRFYCYLAGKLQSFSPVRLPQYEDVFAMTVHKSQGSEFDEVLLILPDKSLPVITRELLYTAITRAKKQVSLVASSAVLETAVARTVQRNSGLAERLSNV